MHCLQNIFAKCAALIKKFCGLICFYWASFWNFFCFICSLSTKTAVIWALWLRSIPWTSSILWISIWTTLQSILNKQTNQFFKQNYFQTRKCNFQEKRSQTWNGFATQWHCNNRIIIQISFCQFVSKKFIVPLYINMWSFAMIPCQYCYKIFV